MAGNFTPAPPNDIDWDAFMNSDLWSELPETGSDFMQGAGAGLSEDALYGLEYDYGCQNSSQSMPPTLKSATIDSPITQYPHNDAIIGHGVAGHTCATGHLSCSSAGKFIDRVGVNFDRTLNSRALDSTLGTALDSGNEDLVSSSSEADAVTTVKTDMSETSNPDLVKSCTCITCLEVGVIGYAEGICRVPGCHQICRYDFSLSFENHERLHFGPTGKYVCGESDCRFGSKKFTDLRRHYSCKHCTNPNAERFPCSEIDCKYSGSNGFTRKDKLQSHQRTVHAGKARPGKLYRVIKPAASGKQPAGAI